MSVCVCDAVSWGIVGQLTGVNDKKEREITIHPLLDLNDSRLHETERLQSKYIDLNRQFYDRQSSTESGSV